MAEVAAPRRAEVEIAQVGLVCTVGRNAQQAALLVRAGHTELRPTPFSDGRHAPRMSQLWDLPEQCVGFERLLRLAVPALHQVVAARPEPAADGVLPGRGAEPWAPERQPIPLLLALPPEGRADDDEDAAARFAAVLSEAAGLRIDGERSVTLRGSHASGVRLFARAMDLLEQGQAEQVVVGGVDGYYHPALLDALDRADELFGSATGGGFLPGEAAAFVLLRRPRPRRAAAGSGEPGEREADEERPRPRLCWAAAERIPDEVLAALLEHEEADQEEDEEQAPSPAEQPSRASSNSAAARAARRAQARLRRALTRLTGGGGRARSWWRRRRARQERARKEAEQEVLPDVTATMADLVKGARAAQSEGSLGWVLTDLNHEAERTNQWSTVVIEAVPADARCDHPMQQLGDAGAATAPVLLALACANWQLGCAPAQSVLIATHSNDADRGVLLLREPS